MPDRPDETQPLGASYDASSAEFAGFTRLSSEEGPAVPHDLFDPSLTASLDDVAEWKDSQPNTDVFNDNPGQFFVAFRNKIMRRAVARPILPISSLIQAGEVDLAGWSLVFNGMTGPVLLRDSADASGPVIAVLSNGNQWYGDGGPRTRVGLYMDLSQAGAVTGAFGSIYLMSEYAK